MKEVYLIVVGKLKDKNLQQIEDDFLKRCKSPSLKVYETKARAEDKDFESSDVIKKCRDLSKGDGFLVFPLSERGQTFTSIEFSSWFFQKIEKNSSKKIIFVIGGAEGHGKEVLDLAQEHISLSKLTFPHKLARVLFAEQFYRAQTIKNQHPYHND